MGPNGLADGMTVPGGFTDIEIRLHSVIQATETGVEHETRLHLRRMAIDSANPSQQVARHLARGQ